MHLRKSNAYSFILIETQLIRLRHATSQRSTIDITTILRLIFSRTFDFVSYRSICPLDLLGPRLISYYFHLPSRLWASHSSRSRPITYQHPSSTSQVESSRVSNQNPSLYDISRSRCIQDAFHFDFDRHSLRSVQESFHLEFDHLDNQQPTADIRNSCRPTRSSSSIPNSSSDFFNCRPTCLYA